MSARIIRIPESMHRTHVLVDGKLIKREKPLPQPKSFSVSGMATAFLLIVGLSGIGILASSSMKSDREILDRACLSSVELSDYNSYQKLDCANR